jgi:hypothetical protein
MMDLSSEIYSQRRNKLRKQSVKFFNVKNVVYKVTTRLCKAKYYCCEPVRGHRSIQA